MTDKKRSAFGRYLHRETKWQLAARARIEARGPSFMGMSVANGVITYGVQKQSAAGVVATVETIGAISQRTSGKRVVLGGVVGAIAGGPLLAGAGLLVGGALKKAQDDRELYLVVQGASETWMVHIDAGLQLAAIRFAGQLNAAGAVPADPQ